MRVLAIAIAGLMLCSSLPSRAASVQARGHEAFAQSGATDFSAAKKRKKQVRKVRSNRDDEFLAIRSQTNQAERAQIACPRSGCQPVPRGCLREPERSFSGDPTGFDRIVCPMR
jgi:hypothetical protein